MEQGTTARDDEAGTQLIIPSITNWVPNRGGRDGKRKKYKSFCGPVAQENESEKGKSKGKEEKNFAMKHGVENSGLLGAPLNDCKRKSNCSNIPTITNIDSHKKPQHATDNNTMYPNAAYHTGCLTDGTEGVLPYGKDRIVGGNENERMCAIERSDKEEKPGLVSRMIKPFLVGRRPVGAYVHNGITHGHTPLSLPQVGPLFVPEVSGPLLLLAANGPGNQYSEGNGMEYKTEKGCFGTEFAPTGERAQEVVPPPRAKAVPSPPCCGGRAVISTPLWHWRQNGPENQ